jgi:NADPH:quinone reductase-like Zn-dependent oxidoreductase
MVFAASSIPKKRCVNYERVFDYRDSALWTRIAAATPGGVDVFFETSRHYDFEHTLPLLALGGRFVTISGIGATVPLPLELLYLRDASLRGFVISNASASDLLFANGSDDDGRDIANPTTRRVG